MRNGCELEAAPMLSGAGHEGRRQDTKKRLVSSLSYCLYSLKDTWDMKIMGKSFPIGTNANVFQTYFMHIHFDVISKNQVVKKLAVNSLEKNFPKLLVSCPSCPALAPSGVRHEG